MPAVPPPRWPGAMPKRWPEAAARRASATEAWPPGCPPGTAPMAMTKQWCGRCPPGTRHRRGPGPYQN
eukprot:7697061-Lingulodinium_polyedra.AAC.1